MPVWACLGCLEDLCQNHPVLPLYSLANDNWIGREKMIVRKATQATRWLASLARFCWKQVRLGSGPQSRGAAQPAEDVRQTGVTGNTIFFAQPSASIPSMEVLPSEDGLLNFLNILFTRSTYNLSDAQWAQVPRAQYYIWRS